MSGSVCAAIESDSKVEIEVIEYEVPESLIVISGFFCNHHSLKAYPFLWVARIATGD